METSFWSYQTMIESLRKTGGSSQTNLQSALDIYTRVYGHDDHADVARVLTELGALYRRRGRFDEAQTNLQSALDIYTRVHGHDDTAVAWVLTELGALYRRRGQLDLAQTNLQSALDTYTRVYGHDHPTLLGF